VIQRPESLKKPLKALTAQKGHAGPVLAIAAAEELANTLWHPVKIKIPVAGRRREG
jgi:hypothetical protein